MSTTRSYYAFAHSYGADTVRSGDAATGTLHIFHDKQMRDKWVEGGPAYRGESGFRTKMKAEHDKVQEYKRAEDNGYGIRRVVHLEDEVKVYENSARPVETAETWDDLPYYAK